VGVDNLEETFKGVPVLSVKYSLGNTGGKSKEKEKTKKGRRW